MITGSLGAGADTIARVAERQAHPMPRVGLPRDPLAAREAG